MLRQLNEAAKHGLAAGHAPEPGRPDWTIDQGWEKYSAAEHAVWRTLFERQSRLLPGRACDDFVAGMANLPIGPHQIPDFRRLSDILMKRTGWQVRTVNMIGRKVVSSSGTVPKATDGLSRVTCGRSVWNQ